MRAWQILIISRLQQVPVGVQGRVWALFRWIHQPQIVEQSQWLTHRSGTPCRTEPEPYGEAGTSGAGICLLCSTNEFLEFEILPQPLAPIFRLHTCVPRVVKDLPHCKTLSWAELAMGALNADVDACCESVVDQDVRLCHNQLSDGGPQGGRDVMGPDSLLKTGRDQVEKRSKAMTECH